MDVWREREGDVEKFKELPHAFVGLTRLPSAGWEVWLGVQGQQLLQQVSTGLLEAQPALGRCLSSALQTSHC